MLAEHGGQLKTLAQQREKGSSGELDSQERLRGEGRAVSLLACLAWFYYLAFFFFIVVRYMQHKIYLLNHF